MNTDQNNDISEPDDTQNVLIVDHLMIRDRATGKVLVNRRGSVVATPLTPPPPGEMEEE